MEAAGSSETPVTRYSTTMLQVSEDSYFHSYFCLPPPQCSVMLSLPATSQRQTNMDTLHTIQVSQKDTPDYSNLLCEV
jgi:hypothetical protein